MKLRVLNQFIFGLIKRVIILGGPDWIRRKFLKEEAGPFLKRDILLLVLKKSAATLWKGLWGGKKLQVASSTWEQPPADNQPKAGTSVLKPKGVQFCQQCEGAWNKIPGPEMKAPWSPPAYSLTRSYTQKPVKTGPDSWPRKTVRSWILFMSHWVCGNKKQMYPFFSSFGNFHSSFRSEIWGPFLQGASPAPSIYCSDSFLLPTSTAITSGVEIALFLICMSLTQ